MLKNAIFAHALGLGTLAFGSCPILPMAVSLPCSFLFPLAVSVLVIKLTLSLGTTEETTLNSIINAPTTPTPAPVPTPEPTTSQQTTFAIAH